MATRHDFSASRRRQTAQDDIHIYRRQLPAEEIVLKDGLPVASAPRTIEDLANLHIDFDHLAQAVKDALSMGAADFSTLSARLDSSAKSYSYDNGDELLDALIEED